MSTDTRVDMAEDKRIAMNKSLRNAVKAYRKGAEVMQQKAEAIRRVFEDIAANKLPYAKSVGRIVKDAGVSVTLFSFFNRSHRNLASNMFFLCRMVMEEGSEFYDDDKYADFHACEEDDCKHQDDFYCFILSNYRATPKIKQLVQQWKDLGPRECTDTLQNDQFRKIFDSLEEELAKDKFKISTAFIDLVR